MGHIVKLVVSDVRLLSLIDQRMMLYIDRLKLEPGFLYGLVGTNLSGRSALLRFIGGGSLSTSKDSQGGCQLLVWSDCEESTVLDVTRDSLYIGPTPRDSMSTLTATVEEELALHKKSGSKTSDEGRGDYDELIADFQLNECMLQNPLALSGGQTSALAFLCALEMRRPILCIDETLAHLDVDLRPRAWEALRDFAHQNSIVLVADNQYDLMAEYADRAIVLRRNCVASVTSLDAAFNDIAVQKQKTIPTVAQLASRIWPDRCNLPTKYQQLLRMIREALRQ